MTHKYSTTFIGGNYIQHNSNLSDSDILLVFDYLFHKQCFRVWEQGLSRCNREDFTISPLCPEKHDSLWQFESLTGKAQVLIERTFSPHEILRVAQIALAIIYALNTRTEQRRPSSEAHFER